MTFNGEIQSECYLAVRQCAGSNYYSLILLFFSWISAAFITDQVTARIMCVDGPKELTFKSAKSCACFHCKKNWTLNQQQQRLTSLLASSERRQRRLVVKSVRINWKAHQCSTWFSLNVMRYIVINRHNINRDVTVIRCGWRISLTRPPVPAKSDPPKPLQANQTCLGLSDRKNNHMTAIDRGKNEKSRPLDSDTVTVSRRIDWPEIDAYTWSKVGSST